MPFLRYANARSVRPVTTGQGWDNVRVAAAKARLDRNLVAQASKILNEDFDPSKWLLSHATIVASVDTVVVPNVRLGAGTVDGKPVNRKTTAFRIKPECEKYINNNFDGWARPVLLKSYPTFVGGHNFLEHVQIEDLSKGRILDAVPRDIGDSIYVDILVATARKHTELIKDIESGALSTLSMGCSIDGSTCTRCGHFAADETEFCFPPGTRVLKADGTYAPIEEIVAGDMVTTHQGHHRPVLHAMSRDYQGDLSVLTVDGVPTPVRATSNHPFWVLRSRQECACGCGEHMHRTVEHERGSAKAFQRRFLPGHNSRVWNHNRSSNVITLEDYTRLFDLDMAFVPAGAIRKGDYLTFPIPQETRDTLDATERRARLIGYFLAEGCYVKREGERVGIEFTFGHHEVGTLAVDVRDLLDAEWGHTSHRECQNDWQARVTASGVKPIKRRATSRPVPADVSCPDCGAPSRYAHNARFRPSRDDCYTCKVCGGNWVQELDRSVRAILYPPAVDGRGSCSVRLHSKAAADWFHHYCGEYSDGKRLPADVMTWRPEIQRELLLAWMNGDGTQANTGITGCTASFHLMSQMHVLAARCGWYGRKQVVFGDRVTDLNQVVNGVGETIARDHRGWLPQFRMVLSEPIGCGQELKFTEPSKARVTLSALTDGFKRVGNWLLYRVRDVATEVYSGIVHNLEVAGDNSYVVEGLAVHNCDHIKYQKGNTFFDERGQKHHIAELCGDESLEPTGGVQFIEASWVGVPAFKGAVARNIITLSSDDKSRTARKIQTVVGSPAPVIPQDGYLKAAREIMAEESTIIFPRDVARKPATMAVIAQDEGFGEDGGEAPPEAPAAIPPPEDPIQKLTDELKKKVLENVAKSLKEDMARADISPALLPAGATMAPNDTVVKQAQDKRAGYLVGMKKIIRTASSDLDTIRKIARLNQAYSIFVPKSLYLTALRVGGSHRYGSLRSFISRCQEQLGRAPTITEARTLIRLAKLLTTRRVGVKPNP